jgi:hypothetical protein
MAPAAAESADPFGASNPMADAALRRRATFASYDEALANFARKAPLNELHPDALAAYVTGGFAPGADGSVTLRCSPATEAEVFRGAGNNEAFAALSEIDLPRHADRARPSRSLRPARGPGGHGGRHRGLGRGQPFPTGPLNPPFSYNSELKARDL